MKQTYTPKFTPRADALSKMAAYLSLGFILLLFIPMGEHSIVRSARLDETPTMTVEATETPSLVLPAPTETREPTATPTRVPLDNIPEPKYDYGCIASDGIVCVNSSMSFEEQVAHTLAKEGSLDGLQLLVDMLQVMHNRAVNAWECSINDCGVENLAALNPGKIPWSGISEDQARRLILYVLSIPYTSRGETHPAFNGWSRPLEMEKVETYERKYKNYLYTVQAARGWLEKCVGYDHEDGNDTCIFLELDNGKVIRPQHAICAGNVLYVYMTEDGLLPEDAPVVAYDKMDYGEFVVYVQFLTRPGHMWDAGR